MIGAAIHSVRAVPRDELADGRRRVAGRTAARPRLGAAGRERGVRRRDYGLTPVALLADAGAWTPRTTAVHATHLTAEDIATAGRRTARRRASARRPRPTSPTASGRASRSAKRAPRLTLGSDSNAVIDMFAEAVLSRCTSGWHPAARAWTADELLAGATPSTRSAGTSRRASAGGAPISSRSARPRAPPAADRPARLVGGAADMSDVVGDRSDIVRAARTPRSTSAGAALLAATRESRRHDHHPGHEHRRARHHDGDVGPAARLVTTPRSSSRAAGSPGSGRRRDAPAADAPRRRRRRAR